MKGSKEKIIDSISISFDEPILAALKQMDVVKRKILIVFDGNQFKGLISIGDVQRAILNNISLDNPIEQVLRKSIDVAYQGDSFNFIKEKMITGRAELMPVLSAEGSLIDVIFWEDLFPEKSIPKSQFNVPVVIMAGGKGTRLRPLTNVIPKPLIPLGDKTIIEEIMDRFVEVGSKHFYLSVNYKAETIKHYFKQLKSKAYKIDYFQEVMPLGTAGSLHLIKDKINSTFFVSNCDIIINEDYSSIMNYHVENRNELTIVSALKHYPIPYGTIETGRDGVLTKLTEKPELIFQINSGMYILESHLLKEVPENHFFHITSLIENILKRNGRVGVFPVSEGSWIDIGEWSEYIDSMKKYKNPTLL
jgi:dTDP-glucose pyrophosphorylase